jgi:hypothetical protein
MLFSCMKYYKQFCFTKSSCPKRCVIAFTSPIFDVFFVRYTNHQWGRVGGGGGVVKGGTQMCLASISHSYGQIQTTGPETTGFKKAVSVGLSMR